MAPPEVHRVRDPAGTLRLADGASMVSGKLDEPGFLQCRVTFPTPAGATLTATAGAAIQGADPAACARAVHAGLVGERLELRALDGDAGHFLADKGVIP